MFYAGICIRESTGEAAAVIFEKVLHQARKQYVVKDLRVWPEGTALHDLIQSASAILADERFQRKKKVFSQNKRPAKNTSTPPTLVVGANGSGAEVIGTMRRDKLPVEGIVISDDDGWKRIDLPILRFGSDYHVNDRDIREALIGAVDKKRILLPEDPGVAKELMAGLDVFLAGGHENVMIQALSYAVWHCERVKQVKRY